MVPNATLHHFVHPAWWHALGGFERHDNVGAFVDFCVFCAREFGRKVKFWATFNEPTCYLVCGYLLGVHPPGKIGCMKLMGTVRSPSFCSNLFIVREHGHRALPSCRSFSCRSFRCC